MEFLNPFYKIYRKIQSVIIPTLKFSQYLYEDILKLYIRADIIWLDLGCGHRILPVGRIDVEKHIIRRCKMIVGIDYDFHSLKNYINISKKVRGYIGKLPFKNHFFDLVTANMVVEHLDNPISQFRGINGILKPGGLFVIHTPNIFRYTTALANLVPNILKKKLIYIFQGRKDEDVFDAYYKANTRKRINNLAKKSGFEVVNIKMIVSSAQFVIIPPLLIFELIWIRILMTKPFKPFRTNIIAILKKQQ